MFSPEQEAQLDRWGCPGGAQIIPLAEIEASAIRARKSGGFSSDSMPKGYRDARQPHDVLAWIGSIDGFRVPGLTLLEDGTWQADAVYSLSGLVGGGSGSYIKSNGPDPYAAVYALVKAAMEAK